MIEIDFSVEGASNMRKLSSNHFFKFEGVTPASADLIYKNGKASQAILYSLLYFPELEKIRDSIVLAWSVSDARN